jgi:hypothetical protein
MTHVAFLTGLVRLLAVYFVFSGLSSSVSTFWFVLEVGSSIGADGMSGGSPWLVMLPHLLYLALAAGLFAAAPWVARICLGRAPQTATQPAPPSNQ